MLSSLANIPIAWSNYWFKPISVDQPRPVRSAVGLACAFWVLSFFPSVEVWFGDSGLLSHDLSARTINYEGFAGWKMWSPLWLVQSTLLIQVWLAIGCLLALTGALGWLGRITWGVLCLWCIAWTHRMGWLAGPTEPLMIASTAYMALQPGSSWLPSQRQGCRNRTAIMDRQRHTSSATGSLLDPSRGRSADATR